MLASMNPTIFVTARRLAPSGVRLLGDARVIYMHDPADPAEVEAVMAREPVDAVVARTVELSARAIAACPTLKVISKHGVGVENIDVAAATARGIPVFITPGANTASVAELTLSLMLAVARRVPGMNAALHAGHWARAEDGLELRGRTLGLVGFGAIGQRVARLAQALEMPVAVHDPAVAGGVDGVRVCGSLDELLGLSQVLSLHLPLGPATRRLIGAPQLAALPDQAILINTARGGLVDEAALVEALRSGGLFGAGLDTLEREPLPATSPLCNLPNLVMTPHVGGSTPAALEAMASAAVGNVLDYLAGRGPGADRCVNPQVMGLEMGGRPPI